MEGGAVMSFWIGLICLAVGLGFILNARAHKKAALAERARRKVETGEDAPAKLHPSLEVMADVGPALVGVFLFMTGLMSTAAFMALPRVAWFSLLDLAGFLALLAAYGHWISVCSEYRFVKPDDQ
jgi:Ca2+/Na+ antiporter